MSTHIASLPKAVICKETYESKVEALHFAEIFRAELFEKLKWGAPVITNSYFPIMSQAIELAEAKMIECKPLDGLFSPYLTRLTEKGKPYGFIFRIMYFPKYEIAYLYGQDYVGDELNFYAATSAEKFDEFITEVKAIYKEYAKKENDGKITIYTVEQGQPRIHKVKFQPITEEQMVADTATITDIKTDLTTFFNGDELFKHFDIAHRRGIMFHGPPGCGKTMMCKHIATVSKVPVVQFFASAGCDTSDLLRFFEYMADISPAIVIFEDLDSLFKGDLARSNFLNIIDGACTDKNLGILIIATTNHVKEIDEAITQRPSRFDRHYLFGYPAKDLRREYIAKRFASVKHLIEDDELMTVFVSETDGMSYAHLNEIYTQAALKAINAGVKKLKVKDIEEAIANVKDETVKKGKEIGMRPESIAPFKSRRHNVYEDDDTPDSY